MQGCGDDGGGSLGFDAAGVPVRATGVRPFLDGKTVVPRAWGGDFGEYASFAGTRVPTLTEAWWKLPQGRFVYWRGRVTVLEPLGTASSCPPERETRPVSTCTGFHSARAAARAG